MHVEEGSSPNRIELVMVGRREPVTAKLQEVLSKVPSLKEAINRGLAQFTITCCTTNKFLRTDILFSRIQR